MFDDICTKLYTLTEYFKLGPLEFSFINFTKTRTYIWDFKHISYLIRSSEFKFPRLVAKDAVSLNESSLQGYVNAFLKWAYFKDPLEGAVLL